MQYIIASINVMLKILCEPKAYPILTAVMDD